MYRRVPSPILPEGLLLSLPIPGTKEAVRISYDDLRIGGYTLGQVVRDLTRYEASSRAAFLHGARVG